MKRIYYQAQTLIDKRMPLSAIVRLFIAFGMLLRFINGFYEYSAVIRTTWIVSLSVFFIYTLVTVGITVYQYKHPDYLTVISWYFFQVGFDTLAFTFFYILTGRPGSDFYLFYFLPLLIAAERFRGEYVLLIFIGVSVFFFAGILALHAIYPPDEKPVLISIVDNGLPRWFFFLVVVLVAFIRGNILREKSEELEAVQKTAVRISKNDAIDARLDAILDTAIELLEAKGCKLYLYMPRENLLKLVALKGLSSDFFKNGYTLKTTEGIVGRVFQQQQPIIENDYKNCSYRVSELEGLFESVIEVPLFLNEPLGVIGVFDTRSRTFSDRDVFILQRLAQYASIAINDALLVDREQKQTNVLKSLYSASESIIDSAFNIDDTLSSIVEHAWKLSVVFNKTPPVFTYFAVYDIQNQWLEFVAAHPMNQLDDLKNRVGTIMIDKKPIGIIGRAIALGKSQNVPDVLADLDYISYNSSTRSQLAVLAKGKRGVIGVLSIEHPDFNAFPQELQEQMEVLAAQAASATENVRMFEQIQFGRLQAEKLRQAAVKISSHTGIKEVGQKILEALRTLVLFDRATLQWIDDKDPHFREIVAKYNLSDENVDRNLLKPISEDKLIQEIVSNKSTLVIPSTKNEPRWELFETTNDIQSWAGIPLVYGDNVVGLITLDNVGEQAFTNENKNVLDLFASHAAGIFQNAILNRKLAEHVEELIQTKDHLESLLNYYNEYQNLALIGLVYGESIHYASNQLGMAKTIMKNMQLGDYDDMKVVAQNAEKAVKYINDYLTVLKSMQEKALPYPSLNSVNIHVLLSRIIESKRKSSKIEIKKTFNAQQPNVKAPEHQLGQVFYVIIQNALDAMSSGVGVLEMKTEMRKARMAEHLLVSISDTGRGIDLSRQQELFKTKVINVGERSHQGTGMGLAWARSFMRSYGGDIYFRTRQNQGTTMYVRVPRDFGSPVIQK